MKTLSKLLCLCAISFETALFGGGYQLSELGSPGLGLAGVGQSAIAQDASTAYFNPAGMSKLCGNQALIGLQGGRFDVRFKKSDTNFVPGDSGGQIGSTLPTLGTYLAWHFNDCVSFGFSVNSPFGAALSYSRHWTGRYVVQSITAASLDFTPTFAIRINRCLSIGGGFIVEYARLWEALAINPATFGGTPGQDGRLELKLDNWETTWCAGALLEFSPQTRIGFIYRGFLRHIFDGSTKARPQTITLSVDTNIVIPQTAVISLYHEVTPCLAMVFDVGFANYGEFEKQIIGTNDGGTVTIPRTMRDIWQFGVGAQYHWTSRLTFQSGFSYASSPQRSRFRAPDLPLDTQYRYGVGVLYDWNRCLTLGSAFEYAYFGRNKMDINLVRGEFKANDAYFLNFTLGKKF